MYGQFVRAPKALVEAATPYVAVKITDLSNLDLNFVRFDFDLTMAIVLMHPDGTVYHRYGSRDGESATSWTSMQGLIDLLRSTTPEHLAYSKSPSPPAKQPVRRAIDLPFFKRRIQSGQRIDCVHCHNVNDAESELTDDPNARWVYPDPRRIGLTLDTHDQSLVKAVTKPSPAASAGIATGDRLLSLDNQRTRTIADVQWALHSADPGTTKLDLSWTRGGEPQQAVLVTEAAWKQCSPREYAWRPYKWALSPAPGFGGPPLSSAEKQRLQIAADVFAFRVQYIVNWGERAHRGRAVTRAGIRPKDVVLSFAGKNDFASMAHFHAWVRLTRQAGEQVVVELLRGSERREVRYRLPK